MVRRQTLREVEVVDDDLDPDAAAAPAAPTHRPHRRALTAGAAGLAVLVVGAVTAQVVTDRRDDARIAAVSALPGAVAPLDGPPQALWGVTDDEWRGTEARAGDGTLVGVRHSTDGPVVVSARDPRTGEVVWEVELVDGTTRPAPDAPDAPDGEVMASSGRCASLPQERHRVVCLVHDGMAVTTAEGDWHAVPASVARVVVLDSGDGSVTTDLSTSLAPTSASSLAVVGDLVVTSATQATPEIHAVTTDGKRAWAHVLSEGPRTEATYAYPVALGDLVAVVTPTAVQLLDAGGAVVHDVPVPPDSQPWWYDTTIYVQPGIETRPGDGTTSEPFTTVIRPDGLVEVTGEPVRVTVDDGSAPGLVLTTGPRGTLRAWDADGRETWSAELAAPWGALVLDGRLHLTSGTALITLDARTGEELWRSEAISSSLVTDGRHLLGVAASTEDDVEMVALDPVNGSELWRSALPDGTESLETYLHLLLAFAVDEVEGTSRLTVLG